jgi:hypothetical protein
MKTAPSYVPMDFEECISTFCSNHSIGLTWGTSVLLKIITSIKRVLVFFIAAALDKISIHISSEIQMPLSYLSCTL